MAWVKLDDAFPDHRKLAEMGAYAPLCGWLYVCGLAFCNRQLTDGLIPKTHVRRLAGFEHLSIETGEVPGLVSFGDTVETSDIAALLVEAGLWEDADRYYRVHDYLKYQPSREAVLAERAKTASRQARWKKQHASNGVSNGVSNAVTTGCPVPDPDKNSTPHTPRKRGARWSKVARVSESELGKLDAAVDEALAIAQRRARGIA